MPPETTHESTSITDTLPPIIRPVLLTHLAANVLASAYQQIYIVIVYSTRTCYAYLSRLVGKELVTIVCAQIHK